MKPALLAAALLAAALLAALGPSSRFLRWRICLLSQKLQGKRPEQPTRQAALLLANARGP
jgi:hypothetical protein